MKARVIAIALVVAFSGSVFAQEKASAPATPKKDTRQEAASAQAAAPTLSDAEQLQFQRLVTKIVAAQRDQLRAQVDYDTATKALEAAQQEVARVLQGWQKDGYELDPNTLTYRKKPPAKAGDGK